MLRLAVEDAESKSSSRILREPHEFSAMRGIADYRVRLRKVASSVYATLRDLGSIAEMAPLMHNVFHQASAIGALRNVASVYGNVLVDTIGSSPCYAP